MPKGCGWPRVATPKPPLSTICTRLAGLPRVTARLPARGVGPAAVRAAHAFALFAVALGAVLSVHGSRRQQGGLRARRRGRLARQRLQMKRHGAQGPSSRQCCCAAPPRPWGHAPRRRARGRRGTGAPPRPPSSPAPACRVVERGGVPVLHRDQAARQAQHVVAAAQGAARGVAGAAGPGRAQVGAALGGDAHRRGGAGGCPSAGRK